MMTNHRPKALERLLGVAVVAATLAFSAVAVVAGSKSNLYPHPGSASDPAVEADGEDIATDDDLAGESDQDDSLFEDRADHNLVDDDEDVLPNQPDESTAAVGYEQPWTTTASTGTVDEADMAIVDLSASLAQIKGSATVPATLDIRYNIVAINTFANILAVRFRDNGPEAQVIVRLKELNLSTGAVATKGTFDSNGFPASSSYQLRSIFLSDPCGGLNLNFVSNAYYLEVQIIKTGPGGFPGLSGMRIAWGLC